MTNHNENQVTVIAETTNSKVIQLADGTFKKQTKYNAYQSRTPQTQAEKIELYQVFNDSESNIVTPMKGMIGKDITIAHVFTSPYEAFDEKTGELTNGVTTTIQDVDGSYYATSSKAVYFTLMNIMNTFGYPDNENYQPIITEVTGKKLQNGVQVNLKLKGVIE